MLLYDIIALGMSSLSEIRSLGSALRSVRFTLVEPPARILRNAFAETSIRRGDDTVGNPHRTQISQIKLFELFLLYS